MFLFAGALLIWALATFGAVLPNSSRALMLVWLIGAAVFSSWHIVRRGRLDFVLAGSFVLGGAGMLCLGPKLGLWIFALLWAWAATREGPKGISRFLHLLLAIGMLEALLGLIQYFAAPGWIFGYQNNQPVSGTLINKNHFSGLLEMIVPICLGLGYIAVRRYQDLSRSYFYVFCGAFMALAIVFSLSRMGIFALLTAIVFMLIVLLLRGSQRRVAVGLGLGVVGLLVAGTLWIGVDVVIEHYQELLAPDALVEEGREIVFRDTARMIRDLPSGVGIGMFQDRFRRYQTFHPELLFDHAHNDYLETTAEWGVVAASLFWTAIIAVEFQFIRSFVDRRSIEAQGILWASAGSVFAILIHSFADFNLQIPSNAILFFTFIGIGLGIVFPQNRGSRREVRNWTD